MVLINPNDNFDIKSSSREIFNWKCLNCGREHIEEKRNFFRREIKCICQKINIRAEEMNKILAEKKYLFLINEENSYSSTSSGMIDLKKPIYVKCLDCGKESYEYYHNLRTEHKRCNCNTNKKFTLYCSTEDFINKWHFLNKENFTLLDGEEYKNRNSKYKIKCNNCGKKDTRWGISLIDGPIKCKYCNIGSKFELIIAHTLDNLKIEYIREYPIQIDNKNYRFDFFIPKYNMMIEYNGEQHYEAFDFFGGKEKLKKTQLSDEIKEKYCKGKNYILKVFSYKQTEKEIINWLSIMFNDYPRREYTISD